MILSRRYRFVFIKAKKVGGTSAEMALSPLCRDPDDIITPITPVDERARLALGGTPRNFARDPADEAAYLDAVAAASDEELPSVEPRELRFHNHISLSALEKQVDLSGLRRLAIVRSPFGRIVSAATHARGFDEYRRTGERMVATPDQVRAVVDRMIRRDLLGRKLLSDRYRDRAGTVDITALRQEHLQEDLDAAVATLGIQGRAELPNAKQGLGLSAREAFELLRPDQRAAIAEAFAEDIRHFGDGLD